MEAKKESVFKGMPVAQAKKRCPALTLLTPNPELAEKACDALGGVVARYTPLWEPSRPGHIYLDVTGTQRLWGKAKNTAYRLGQEIKARLSLPGDLGVASNKMVSSIASRIMPGEGVLDVGHGQESSFMAPLKVDLLPGIGHFRRNILLQDLNITLVRELALLDMGTLKLIFGRQADLIRQRAVGIDPTPVYPSSLKPMISEEIMLPQDDNNDRRLLAALYGLTENAAYRLRDRGLFPRKAGVLIRYSDQVETKRQIKLHCPSFWDFDLYAPLEKLFLKTCRRRVRTRFIRIWFWDFSPPSSQLSLFHDPAPDTERTSSVLQALDRIRQRHGKEAIKYVKGQGEK